MNSGLREPSYFPGIISQSAVPTFLHVFAVV